MHTREVDTSYVLNGPEVVALPANIKNLLNPHHEVSVRVTTDQKTGKEIAKIIKFRRSDLEVNSPQTLFDWRVSINIEAPWPGNKEDLDAVPRKEGSVTTRTKDRLSYRHQAYQIDLTQVTKDAVSLRNSVFLSIWTFELIQQSCRETSLTN